MKANIVDILSEIATAARKVAELQGTVPGAFLP